MINGKVGVFGRNDERAGAHGHGPVLLSGALQTDSGLFPVGLLLSRLADGVLAPLAVVVDAVIATGNGSTKAYSTTLGTAPIEPGTVSISDGVESFHDDGHGRLIGDAGGSGVIDYGTATLAMEFAANVVSATEVLADYTTAIDGVLDDLADTAMVSAANYIVHGTVRREVLKVGVASPVAPSAALLMRLQKRGIYAVG